MSLWSSRWVDYELLFFNSRYPLYLVAETHTPSLIFQGWTDEAAALVCQQLGLIYSPDQGASSLRVSAPPDMPVLMSWVSCDEVDDDLTRCRALRPPDINCDHDRDVYLRCQDPTWAGEVWEVFVIVISVLMFFSFGKMFAASSFSDFTVPCVYRHHWGFVVAGE